MGNKYIELDKQNTRDTKKVNKATKHFSLGMIVYFSILLYLIFCIISFTTNKKINYAVAEVSKIVDVDNFHGMIIRDEMVYKAERKGFTTFFYPEGARVKKDAFLVVIDQNDRVTNALKDSKEDSDKRIARQVQLSAENYEYLNVKLKDYLNDKDNKAFVETYYIKYALQKAIKDMSNTAMSDKGKQFEVLQKSSAAYDAEIRNNSGVYQALQTGIISYTFDGFEDVKIDNYTLADLNRKEEFQKPAIENDIVKGAKLYKIIDNYEWYIVAEINDKLKRHIEENNNSIRIMINHKELKATVENMYYENDKSLAVFKLVQSMEEYLDKRFVDFNVVYNEVKGIKIPNSAVLEKKFYALPVGAIRNDGQKNIILKRVDDGESVNSESAKEVDLSYVIYHNNKAYIPLDTEVEKGDKIICDENDKTDYDFTLNEVISYEGTYVINQGFVEFKPIETIYLTEDYRIINDQTKFVLIYDRIVIDAKEVNENDFIY